MTHVRDLLPPSMHARHRVLDSSTMRSAPWYAALLLIATCILVCDARYLKDLEAQAVTGGPAPLTGWPGVEGPAEPSQEEATEFLRENVDPQLRHWRDGNLTPQVLEEFAKELVVSPHNRRVNRVAFAVLRNNTLTAMQYLKGSSMYWRFESLQSLIRRSGLEFPDTAFLFNIADQTVCGRGTSCAAPIFSTYSHQEDLDALFPVTNHAFELHNFPWEKKLPVAFGRAAHNYDHSLIPDGMTTRAHLAIGSMKYPERLDFGLVALGFPEGGKPPGLEKVPPVPVKDHPRWKYLVTADGVTASNRLGKVLLMNSVTLKEESPYIEFFYRSAKPWVHYVPFQSGSQAVPSLLEAVQQLQANDTLAQQISQAGQTFASKFLTPSGRAWYIQNMLRAYNQLYGDGVMEAWMAERGPEKLAAQLKDLLKKKA